MFSMPRWSNSTIYINFLLWSIGSCMNTLAVKVITVLNCFTWKISVFVFGSSHWFEGRCSVGKRGCHILLCTNQDVAIFKSKCDDRLSAFSRLVSIKTESTTTTVYWMAIWKQCENVRRFPCSDQPTSFIVSAHCFVGRPNCFGSLLPLS